MASAKFRPRDLVWTGVALGTQTTLKWGITDRTLLTRRPYGFCVSGCGCPMLGLVNSAVEVFLRETYGPARWREVRMQAGFDFERFEPLLTYDRQVTDRLLVAASQVLDRPSDVLLEDLGHWLVAARSGGRLRRLLRFGGASFGDFLLSLEDLPARARLALAELDLPALRLASGLEGEFLLHWDEPFAGAGAILSGVLRSMADDYGALVLIDREGQGKITLSVHVLSESHGTAREFDLVHAAG